MCDFCHMTGHTKSKCYCIHGYLSWHKLFGKPKPKPRFNSKVSSAALVTSSESSVVPTVTDTGNHSLDYVSLSDGQCKQLIMYLQNSMTASTDTESQAINWS